MKSIYFTAAALLLGTSALAWAPSTAPVAKSDKAKAATMVAAGAKATRTTLVAKSNDLPAISGATKAESAAWGGDDAKILAASATGWDKPDAMAKAEPMADGNPDLDLAETSIDTAPVKDELAMGGPLEPVEAADTAPAAAAGNYPACRPGPGDDSCIQLYEPGVRTALASWNRPTGGFAGGNAVAMGGPYEPVDEEASDFAMNGDGLVDGASGETAETEVTGL